MTPLDPIFSWFENQEKDIQIELVALISHFLFDDKIELEFDEEKKIELFKKHLTDKDLTPKEICQRVLYLKSLINFCIDDRDTEEGWEKTRQLNESIIESAKSEGKYKEFNIYDNFMKTYHDRKNKWIVWSKNWRDITQTDLSARNISNWYFSASRSLSN